MVEARPLFDLERTRRAWRLLVSKPMATDVDVARIDVARALASDPRKALPLLVVILDRIVHRSHRIGLKGESLRKQAAKA